MKNLLFLFLTLFTSLSLFAVELPRFEGTYRFSDADLYLQQIQHTVRLTNSTQQGQDLLQSYRSQNYECIYKGSNIYQCKSFLKNLIDNSELREQIILQYNHVGLSFSIYQDDYVLVNEGEVLQEYENAQKSSFGDQNFDRVHLYISPDLKKFKLFNQSGVTEHFYLNSNGDIAKQVQKSKVNKKTSAVVVEDKYTYLYEGIWKK